MRPDRLAAGKRKAERVIEVWYRQHPRTWREHPEWRDDTLRSMTYTRVRCSCPGCGNPRRWFGERTIQELRSDFDMRDEIVDAFNLDPIQNTAWQEWYNYQECMQNESDMILYEIYQ